MPMRRIITVNRKKRINWQPFKAIIHQLFWEEGVTFDELPRRMRKHGLTASRRSYCSKLGEWGWRRRTSRHLAFSAPPPPAVETGDTVLEALEPESLEYKTAGTEEVLETMSPINELKDYIEDMDALQEYYSPDTQITNNNDIPMLDLCSSLDCSGLVCIPCFTTSPTAEESDVDVWSPPERYAFFD